MPASPHPLRVGPTQLAAGAAHGAVQGTTTAVKDLIDVRGVPTGAGNPDWLADAAPAAATAPAVQRLLDAGTTVIGKSHTDELAFSLSGTNVHYGTPLNTAAPDRIPGGSSSGSAAAVAAGMCDLGVGTDTGGSIRVPASYCGIFGWRPTHGRVPMLGCVPLAPSFDTIGLLARDGALLRDAARVLLDTTAADATPQRLLIATDLLALADDEVATAVRREATQLGDTLGVPVDAAELAPGAGAGWLDAFRARQLVEAWRCHGDWITRRRPAFGPGIAARFAAASDADPADAAAADRAADDVRDALDRALGPHDALVLPAAATVAPRADLDATKKDDLRRRTMMLTCVAGLAGAPALSMPIAHVPVPIGLGLVARRGADEMLLAAAARA